MQAMLVEAALPTYMRPKALISAEAKKSPIEMFQPIWMTYNSL